MRRHFVFFCTAVAMSVAVLIGCGDDGETPTPPSNDTTAPSAVTDLTCTAVTDNSVTLSWTAPGDDGDKGKASKYEIRYSPSYIDSAAWSASPSVLDPPTPKAAGEDEEFEVKGLASDTHWYFAIKSADEVPIWSAISNCPDTTTAPDVEAPADITDLTVSGWGETTVTLTWTAPGDNGHVGTASAYQIRYASSEIDSLTWDAATTVPNPPTPQEAGSTESFQVTNLHIGTYYCFAVKARDEVDNWSRVSNSPSVTTDIPHILQVTTHPMNDYAPAYSPDGSMIAFTSNRSGSDNIWVIPAVGGVAEQITTFGAGVTASWPTWSPSGDTLAYQRSSGGSVDIWATPGVGGVLGSPYQIANLPTDIEYPEWSHDGTRITFSQKPGANRDIYYVTLAGGAVTQVTNDALPNSGPCWSPDDSEIAYHTIFNGHYQIYKIATGGGSPQVLTADNRDEQHPSWDPLGTYIAIMKNNSQNWMDIHLLNVATLQVTPLTDDTDSVHNSHPSFSPDGSRVAYTFYTAGAGDIYTIAAR